MHEFPRERCFIETFPARNQPATAHADRTFPARYSPQHGNDTAALRMHGCGCPYHRAGRLSHLRPGVPPCRHGLSRPGAAHAPHFLEFEKWRQETGHRLVLFTTKGATSYLDFHFSASDILLFGRETVGVTDEVMEAADARLKIPLQSGLRSLNVAMAAAMAIGEALRQTRSST